MKPAILPGKITDPFVRDKRIVSREGAKARSNPASFAVFAASREPCLGNVEVTCIFHFRRTSEVSHARTSAQAVSSDDKAPSGGIAPSRIAGPIRALAVVTGSAIG